MALFYAIATALGGTTGPIIFAQLIDTGDRSALLVGYGIAAGLMIVAAIAELLPGARAERRSLESVAAPLTAIRDMRPAVWCLVVKQIDSFQVAFGRAIA